MAVKILPGMTLADAAIASAGSFEDVFALAALNGLNITDDVAAGEVLLSTGNTYPASSKASNDHITVKAVQVLPDQTIADMAVQQLGSLEAVFALAVLNNLSVTDDLEAGQQLNYNIVPYSKAIVQAYQKYGYKPACGTDAPGQGQPVQLQGIGYWYIEKDFIVS